MRDNKGMGLLIIAAVLVVAFSGNAMATVIDVGSAGYSWGTGSGIISWQGYAGETSPAEGSLPISGSEWTYTIQVLTGDLHGTADPAAPATQDLSLRRSKGEPFSIPDQSGRDARPQHDGQVVNRRDAWRVHRNDRDRWRPCG